jgi:hypothetical protein
MRLVGVFISSSASFWLSYSGAVSSPIPGSVYEGKFLVLDNGNHSVFRMIDIITGMFKKMISQTGHRSKVIETANTFIMSWYAIFFFCRIAKARVRS